MKKKNKDKLKKVAKLLIQGSKKTGKFVGKYGPKAHAFLKGVSESTAQAFDPNTGRQLIPRRRKGYVDFTKKKKPTRVLRRRGGFYLDFT